MKAGADLRRTATLLVSLWIGVQAAGTAAAAPDAMAGWERYLDYAYVYSSAQPEALEDRLRGYAAELGVSLGDYIVERFEGPGARARVYSDADKRRRAVAYLLEFLAHGDPGDMNEAALGIRHLDDRLDRHENRYWYHYILAHEAIQLGDADGFVEQVLALWLGVISRMEAPFETYDALSLNSGGGTGFVAALPHLHENVARLIVLRSQDAGLEGNLDALASVVRMLNDGRLGGHPDVIPAESSARDYVAHLVERLDGAESDGGSLSFVLALVAAERAHNEARRALAGDAFSPTTLAASREAVAAYQRALRRADTLQGHCAVYTRALRQLGEVYAAQQRLGARAGIDVPFSIDRAIGIYEKLYAARGSDWGSHGYRESGREAFASAMRGLWAEIQETTFNAADFYLSERGPDGARLDESIVTAVNHYARYLHLFEKISTAGHEDVLPESAYFGAYVAAKGIGDSVLLYSSGDASSEQLDEAIAQYQKALAYYPFDRTLWATLSVALERRGREHEFMALAAPLAEAAKRSRHLDLWITYQATAFEQLTTYRDVFASDVKLFYFGFADETRIGELEANLEKMQDRADASVQRIAMLEAEREQLDARRREAHRRQLAASAVGDEPSGLPSVSAPPRPEDTVTIARLSHRIEGLQRERLELEEQIAAVGEALPVFKEILTYPDLVAELAGQRDHAVHGLLRRMAHELVIGAAVQAESNESRRKVR